MKILLAHNYYQEEPGGEGLVFEQECQLLERNGHQVITYKRSNHELNELSTLRRVCLLKNIISAQDSKNEINQILRSEVPDLVHVHNTFVMISPSIYEACQKAGVPVFQTLHNYRLLCPGATFYREGQICEECNEHSLLRGVWHGCYRSSRSATAAVALMLKTHRALGTWSDAIDGYIALTEFVRSKFIDAGWPAAKIHTKPNFVAEDPGERDTIGTYALFVGRLSPEKGVSTLIAAWNRLAAEIPLKIVGDGPMRQSLEAEARKNRLPNITFLGRMNTREVCAAMKQARFLIVPSVCPETFGMVIVESFASGVPVLGSRIGSIQEIIDDGRTGLHFTPGDPSDLADKVQWAWNHSPELEAMGKAARRKYEASYTPERNYRMLMGIYEQVLGKQPGG